MENEVWNFQLQKIDDGSIVLDGKLRCGIRAANNIGKAITYGI
jgi:hypothetical protein